jgi:hypothetical protein
MSKRNCSLVAVVAVAALAAFIAGRWSSSNASVKADSMETPQIEIRPIGGDSSLTVYYPSLNKLFVYQNPFVGLPKWSCSYSVQLSTPGGPIERQPCSNSVQVWK